VLFAGRVVGAKGLGVLLEAASGLDCSVAVYGDGWWLPRARRQAERIGIDDRVVFHGWTDEQELNRGYMDSRVAVLPSLWPEPFGLVGIEAMAHARAVVASDTGGVREWLVEGETGYLVPPGDPDALRAALSRLLDDYDLSVQMGLAGAARGARLFSSAAHVASLGRVYGDAGARWQSTSAERNEP
jgi:glycosyltransferase involved in cell wall biosynthesis